MAHQIYQNFWQQLFVTSRSAPALLLVVPRLRPSSPRGCRPGLSLTHPQADPRSRRVRGRQRISVGHKVRRRRVLLLGAADGGEHPLGAMLLLVAAAVLFRRRHVARRAEGQDHAEVTAVD